MSKKTKSKVKESPSGKRTLFVKFRDDDQKKIVIPAGCKVTFGPLCPGTKGEHNGNHAISLRIYNGLSQIACFVKVESFYEIDSVACISKKTKRATKSQAYEEDGVMKNRNVAVEVSEWKDEQNEEEESDATGVFKALKAEHSDSDDE